MTTDGGARPAYITVLPGGNQSSWGFLGLILARHGRFSLGRAAALYAVFLIALPAIAASIYYIALASPIYVTEASFAVRSVQAPMQLAQPLAEPQPGAQSSDPDPGALSAAGRSIGLDSSGFQDPFIVASFMMSPDFVARMDTGGWLRQFYSRPDIDSLSRLAENASSEAVFAHWRRHFTAAVDRRSNAVLLASRAYSGPDAQAIARRALDLAGTMLGELTERQREDTLVLAQGERAAAESRYTRAVLAIQEMRDASRIVDPATEVEEAGKTLLGLISQRIDLESQVGAAQRMGVRSGPGLEDLTPRIAALDLEIDAARSRLTGVSRDEDSILETLAIVEALELERRFAQRLLDISTLAYAQAVQEMESQSAFLLVYLEPAAPTDPSEPNPLAAIAFVVGLALIAWLFATTATAVVADQMS